MQDSSALDLFYRAAFHGLYITCAESLRRQPWGISCKDPRQQPGCLQLCFFCRESIHALLCPDAEEPPKRPTLVRHSISRAPPLSLEASDAASEMQDPGHKPGQQPEWWQNRRASTSAPRRQMQRSASSGRLQPARPEARLRRSKTGLKLNHQVRHLLVPAA